MALLLPLDHIQKRAEFRTGNLYSSASANLCFKIVITFEQNKKVKSIRELIEAMGGLECLNEIRFIPTKLWCCVMSYLTYIHILLSVPDSDIACK